MSNEKKIETFELAQTIEILPVVSLPKTPAAMHRWMEKDNTETALNKRLLLL